jgi:hypothetical protein
MHAVRVARDGARVSDLEGRVLCHELRSEDGRVAIAKGRVLDERDTERALGLAWGELHLLALDPDDVHEDEAGDHIARLVAGDGVTVRSPSGGHWPIASERRGLLSVDADRLERVNALDGPCVYSLYHGQVVEAGEVVARAKIIPFAVTRDVLGEVDSIIADRRGAIRVRGFKPHRIGAVVHESLGDRAVGRFRGAVAEKVGWFGSALCAVEITPPTVDAIAGAFTAATRDGVDIVLVAGTKAMDMLDPTFTALQQLDARMVGHGVPAHPGSLLWLAEWKGIPIVGMPTCGLFAQATVFDLVIARLLTGERLGRGDLAALGHGGFLTRDMAFRLPAYRAAAERGTVES